MIQNNTDWCHHRGQLREGSRGSEPSGSGRHEGEGVWEEMKGSLWYNSKLLFISGGKSCSTTNSMNITGLQWVDVLYLLLTPSRINLLNVFCLFFNMTALTNPVINPEPLMLSGCHDAVWAGVDVNQRHQRHALVRSLNSLLSYFC